PLSTNWSTSSVCRSATSAGFASKVSHIASTSPSRDPKCWYSVARETPARAATCSTVDSWNVPSSRSAWTAATIRSRVRVEGGRLRPTYILDGESRHVVSNALISDRSGHSVQTQCLQEGGRGAEDLQDDGPAGRGCRDDDRS